MQPPHPVLSMAGSGSPRRTLGKRRPAPRSLLSFSLGRTPKRPFRGAPNYKTPAEESLDGGFVTAVFFV
jgi:hypothetical protein